MGVTPEGDPVSGDERFRELERAALAGDREALARLRGELARRGHVSEAQRAVEGLLEEVQGQVPLCGNVFAGLSVESVARACASVVADERPWASVRTDDPISRRERPSRAVVRLEGADVVVHAARRSPGSFVDLPTLEAALADLGAVPLLLRLSRGLAYAWSADWLERIPPWRMDRAGDLTPVGPASWRGTRITLRPDPTIFGEAALDAKRVAGRLAELAFIRGGMTFELDDRRTGDRRTFLAPRGLLDELVRRVAGRETLLDEPLVALHEADGARVELALTWVRSPEDEIASYANDRVTTGGTHVEALRAAVSRALAVLRRGARPRAPRGAAGLAGLRDRSGRGRADPARLRASHGVTPPQTSRACQPGGGRAPQGTRVTPEVIPVVRQAAREALRELAARSPETLEILARVLSGPGSSPPASP